MPSGADEREAPECNADNRADSGEENCPLVFFVSARGTLRSVSFRTSLQIIVRSVRSVRKSVGFGRCGRCGRKNTYLF